MGKPSVASDMRPAIIIRALAEAGSIHARIAEEFGNEMIFQLASDLRLTVLVKDTNGSFLGRPLYVLKGNVQQDGGRQRATAILLREADGVVIWVKSEESASDGVRFTGGRTAESFAASIADSVVKDVMRAGLVR